MKEISPKMKAVRIPTFSTLSPSKELPEQKPDDR
jgi:hypothetical protein